MEIGFPCERISKLSVKELFIRKPSRSTCVSNQGRKRFHSRGHLVAHFRQVLFLIVQVPPLVNQSSVGPAHHRVTVGSSTIPSTDLQHCREHARRLLSRIIQTAAQLALRQLPNFYI